MPLTHKVSEAETRIERSESYSADVGAFRVFMNVDNDGFATVAVMPIEWDRMRIPALTLHPKRVSDLEQLADALPELLRGFAAELRAAGMDDLRSRFDKMRDEDAAETAAMLAKLRTHD